MKAVSKKLVFLSILTLVLAFSVNAQTNNKCAGGNNLTDPEISAILEAHNKIRSDLKLPKIVWKCSLADAAQEWATRGKFEHRSNPTYGENLFVASDTKISPLKAVEKWLTEKAFWDNEKTVCKTGKVCSHYTQIIWKKTTEIGCGINRNALDKWKVLMVCNYNPMQGK